MRKYMKILYEDFEEKYILNGTRMTPAVKDLFSNDVDSPRLDKEMREDFHHFTAQGLFAAKRARPDMATSISVLTTCVRNQLVNNWAKLVRYIPVSYTHLTLPTIYSV